MSVQDQWTGRSTSPNERRLGQSFAFKQRSACLELDAEQSTSAEIDDEIDLVSATP
jgi:hypothetical protein